MSTPVDRLQALLGRVQQNRGKARAQQEARQEDVDTLTAPPAGYERPARPAAVAAAPEPRPKPKAPTPLEMAVEGRIGQPAIEAVAAPRLVSARPQVAPPPPAADSVMVIEGAVPEPSKPIMHVVSTHPPTTAPSFGELLRRSLSLRPR